MARAGRSDGVPAIKRKKYTREPITKPSMVNVEEKKERPCLRCNKMFLTVRSLRICHKCTNAANAKEPAGVMRTYSAGVHIGRASRGRREDY